MNKLAVMLDVSRSRLLKNNEFKRHLTKIKKLGYTQVFLNIEHVFKIPKYSKIGQNADSLSEEEWRELDQFAINIDLEIIPVIQSFGHLFHILKWEEYQYLSESDDCWSIAPIKESYDFFKIYYKAVSRAFSSKWIHIGGDEVYDLGNGKSKSRITENFTKEDLFIEHIKQLQTIASSNHKKIMIWGDMLEKSLKILDIAKNDIAICFWNYDFREFPKNYYNALEKIEYLYLCSGTNTWKSSFPRMNYAVNNYYYMNNIYKKLVNKFPNKIKMMVTDWGDGGHIHGPLVTELMLSLAKNVYSNNQVKNDNFEYNENLLPNELDLALTDFVQDENLLEILKKSIILLDRIHFGKELNNNVKIVWNRSFFITRYLFLDSALKGNSFTVQSKDELNKLIDITEELENLEKQIKQIASKEKNQLITEILLNIDFTKVLTYKVKLHLSYREKNEKSFILEIFNCYIFNMRDWMSKYFAYWEKTSENQGQYYLQHFFTKALTKEISNFNYYKKMNYDYDKIKVTDYSLDEDNLSLFSIGNCKGLKALWKNHRL